MRELKFRVWSKQKSQWVENMMLLACIDGLPFAHFVEVGDDKSVKHPVYNASGLECVIQQYTGLKDKKGKEIYEGDILNFSHLNYSVYWRDYEWVATCPYYHKYHWPTITPFRNVESGEIIGNIFENPELLKK